MARPSALLCGVDRLRCFEEFWAAGYSVDRCDNEYELVRWLLRGKVTDLICVLEAPERSLDTTSLALVKGSINVPMVLFRARDDADGRGLWNLEVAPSTPSRDWLQSVEALIIRGGTHNAEV
jgi:hypothetical protein